jgi:hypothetical protein
VRSKDALKDVQFCVLKDGCVNGIKVDVDKSDMEHSMFTYLLNAHDDFTAKIKRIANFESMSLRKIDYAYTVSECAEFTSNDPTRYFMFGIYFDFYRGGKDCVNIVATEGRKLCLITDPAI